MRARTFPPYRGAYFKDGGKKVYLRLGFELCEWSGGATAYCPAQIRGKSQDGKNYAINIYAVTTDPDKEIESVELTQKGGITPMVFAVTAGKLSKEGPRVGA